jgi:hypothetical protein
MTQLVEADKSPNGQWYYYWGGTDGLPYRTTGTSNIASAYSAAQVVTAPDWLACAAHPLGVDAFDAFPPFPDVVARLAGCEGGVARRLVEVQRPANVAGNAVDAGGVQQPVVHDDRGAGLAGARGLLIQMAYAAQNFRVSKSLRLLALVAVAPCSKRCEPGHTESAPPPGGMSARYTLYVSLNGVGVTSR